MREGQSRGKKGNKKYGRDKVKCARYRSQNKREKNQIRRLTKLLKKAERLGWSNVGDIKKALSQEKDRLLNVGIS